MDKDPGRLSRRKRSWRWLLLIVVLVGLAVFGSEPWIVDHFRKGHFNWVSLHSLAIVRHSIPETGGVGYTCKRLLEAGSGNYTYDYFNRYPVPFAILSKLVLTPWENSLTAYLYAARQWMNLIFLVTLAALYLLLRLIGTRQVLAGFAVLGTALAPALLYYKSMFHFDQPAVLAYVLVIAVALRTFTAESLVPWPYLATVGLAALTGRSAITLTYALALALVLTARSVTSHRRENALQRARAVISWWGLILSLSLVAVTTGYNVFWEAAINSQPLLQTSIVGSSLRRLGFLPQGDTTEHLERARWLGGAIPELIENVSVYISPALTISLIVLVVMSGLLLLRRRLPWPDLLLGHTQALDPLLCARRSLAWQSIGLGSFIWLVLMKNLLVFHEYAAMMLVPLLTLLLAAVAERVFLVASRLASQQAAQWISAASLAVVVVAFFWQSFAISAERLRPSGPRLAALDSFFAALHRFRAESDPDTPVLRDVDWLPGSRFAQCLLLDQPLWEGSPETAPPLVTPPSFPRKP